jgi:predicted TIM-barrel fold metal-dependent hydrolase
MRPCPPPLPHPRKPLLTLPPGSCDCHAHVFGPPGRYPLAAKRGYTPPETPLEQYLRLLETLGVGRGVIVTPSAYGRDNAATLDALAGAGGRLRGVAVVDESAGEAELERLAAGGIRGVRFNLVSGGGVSLALLETMAARIAPLGWHVQLFVALDALPALEPRLKALPVPAVIDHMGHVQAGTGLMHPGFQALLRLVRHGSWVKLSAPYRLSRRYPDFPDVLPYVRALLAAGPERVVWGSDWPHVGMWEQPMPDDGDLVDLLETWMPDPEQRRRVLVDNPARLYGFEAGREAPSGDRPR